jgi:hypothetical protein
MPKVEIDYSNTIFYKIFCKDAAIKELYVGLTTNFVQRKHAHKQSCKNEKALNHNCKLYNAIRNAGGWDNWQMEIIAFHNCANSYEARKKEQEYFEALGATLNSIDPFPKPKIKEPPAKIIKEKKILFCQPCNVYFSHWTTQETHNNTRKHHKMVAMHIPTPALNGTKINPHLSNKFCCDKCNYITDRKSNMSSHIASTKHLKNVDGTNIKKFLSNLHDCKNCNNIFKTASGLWKHHKKCIVGGEVQSISLVTPSATNNPTDKDLIMMLIKENSEMKNMMMQLLEKVTPNITTHSN